MCLHTTIKMSSQSDELVLLYMCPHTAMYVSSYDFLCVLILVMCPHTTIQMSSQSDELVLLYICPHTAICVLILLCVSSYYMCPHTPRCPHTIMCPHTTICAFILLCVLILYDMCPHTTVYVSSYSYLSSYYYIGVLILRCVSSYYMCPHPPMCPDTSI